MVINLQVALQYYSTKILSNKFSTAPKCLFTSSAHFRTSSTFEMSHFQLVKLPTFHLFIFYIYACAIPPFSQILFASICAHSFIIIYIYILFKIIIKYIIIYHQLFAYFLPNLCQLLRLSRSNHSDRQIIRKGASHKIENKKNISKNPKYDAGCTAGDHNSLAANWFLPTWEYPSAQILQKYYLLKISKTDVKNKILLKIKTDLKKYFWQSDKNELKRSADNCRNEFQNIFTIMFAHCL